MDRAPGFDETTQRYLDGEAAQPSAEARAEADRFAALVDRYSVAVEPPSPSLDAEVMARIGARGPATSVAAGFTRWLLRPLPAAAILVLALATGVLVGRMTVQPGVPEGAAAADAPREFLVRFELNAPEARNVSVVGSFTDWDGAAIPLVREPDSSLWSAVVPLSPGQHEYLFVIDGERWIPDPDAQAQVDDGFGSTNSIVVVGPRGVARS